MKSMPPSLKVSEAGCCDSAASVCSLAPACRATTAYPLVSITIFGLGSFRPTGVSVAIATIRLPARSVATTDALRQSCTPTFPSITASVSASSTWFTEVRMAV